MRCAFFECEQDTADRSLERNADSSSRAACHEIALVKKEEEEAA